MNIKPRITTIMGGVIVSMALTTAPALADQHFAFGKRNGDSHVYDYAKVLSVKPIVRYVTIETPVRECWEETRHYTVERRPNTAGSAGRTVPRTTGPRSLAWSRPRWSRTP